jgi:ubiquitin C-terminal hydrolase
MLTYHNGFMHKALVEVAIPSKLSLNEFSLDGKECIYTLRAVCNHSGSSSRGHYTCSVLRENRWDTYDDDVVIKNVGMYNKRCPALIVYELHEI